MCAAIYLRIQRQGEGLAGILSGICSLLSLQQRLPLLLPLQLQLLLVQLRIAAGSWGVGGGFGGLAYHGLLDGSVWRRIRHSPLAGKSIVVCTSNHVSMCVCVCMCVYARTCVCVCVCVCVCAC